MRRRRGIGTVIASGIFIFLMLLTISQVYIYAFDEFDDYNRVAMQVYNINAQKQSERITIQNAQLDLSGQYMAVSLTVANTGGVTSHVIAIWLADLDLSTLPHIRVPEDVFVGAGRTVTIGSLATDIPSTSRDKVRATVETQLGNTASIELLPPSLEGTTPDTLATTTLTLIPPSVITGNVLVASLTVTNDNRLGAAFTSLTPDVCVVIGSASPGQNCHKAAGNNLCDSGSGKTVASPVSCIGPAGNAATPPGLSFLPAGGTVTFSWAFSVTTIVPDTPITFMASYVNLTTTGLFASQMPASTALVRGPGGASSTAGGNFQTAFGDLVAFFSSFQYTQDGSHWSGGSVVPGGTPTLFRVNVTNLGSEPIALNGTSEIILSGISSLSTAAPGHLTDYTKEFYIVHACPATNCFTGPASVAAYSVRTSIAPGATVTLYFGATTAGSTSVDSTPGSGINALVVLSLVGNSVLPPSNPPYAQASVVLVTRLT